MGRILFSALLTALLVACAPQGATLAQPVVAVQSQAAGAAVQLQGAVRAVVAPAVVDARESAATTVTPLLVDAQAAVQMALPDPAPAARDPWLAPAAVDLIVRWEVTSPAYYGRRLQRPIWPGGSSGITWGVGYDGGTQTTATILRDWEAHPDAAALATVSGVVGERARAALPAYRRILTPYPLAYDVFAGAVLPAYQLAARRALGDGFDALSPNAAGALVSLGYNRGWSFAGDRRREMRVIRDTCVPANDAQCIAQQLVAMCRLWSGERNGAGLCARRHDEARVAVSA